MFIVATISKNSYAAEKIEEILLAGATVLRFNFSHGTPEEMARKIQVARGVIVKLGLEEKIKIMADLPGDKIRLGDFPQKDWPVKQSDKIIFKTADFSENPADFIPVHHPEIGKLVRLGQVISCGDGEIGFKVTSVISQESFEAEALNSRHIPALKGLNLGRGIDKLDHFTQQTLEHIKYLSTLKPEWVAFSFVNSAAYLKKAKKLLIENGLPDAPIVAKLESPLAIANLDEIAENCDILLVARGDLPLYAPMELLGVYQKKIVAAARKHGKQSIVSTQILDSLLSYHTPSRAEVLDLTNIVLDGANGIMLAKETGISMTPGYSVEVAKKIIEAVENSKKEFIQVQ